MKPDTTQRWVANSRRLSLGAIVLLLFLMPFSLSWMVVDRPIQGVLPEFHSLLFYASDALLLLALLAWLGQHLLIPSRPVRLGPWFITLPLVWLGLLSVSSLLWAPAFWVAAEAAARLLAGIALYLLLLNEIKDFRSTAYALVAGMVVQSLLATLQFTQQAALGLTWLGESEVHLTVPELWVRGFGLSRHPNILGGYLLLGLAAVLALSLLDGVSNKTAAPLRNLRKFPVWGLSLAAGVSGLLSTFSRSAWIGVATGWGLAALLISWPGQTAKRAVLTFWSLAVVALLVLTLFLLAYPDLFFSRLVVPLLPRLGFDLPDGYGYEMENLAERADYTAVAHDLIAARPVLGVGSGNFSIASIRNNPVPAADHAYLPVHNVLLLITAELGLSGGLAWLLLIGGWLAATGRRWRQLTSDRWFLAWSLALWGLFLTGVWDFYIWGWQYGRLFFFAALGLWSAAYSRQ